jgi:DNA-binding response OmpR family regulator
MKTLRVVVVEDDAVVGATLAETLEAMGYEVCAIEVSEAGAVTAADRCKPDLMIVDVRLGDGSGVAAIEAILRARPVTYLFVSGEKVQGSRPGAVVLRKPYFERDLAGAIRRAFDASVATH